VETAARRARGHEIRAQPLTVFISKLNLAKLGPAASTLAFPG
jgi:hypothetical protein